MADINGDWFHSRSSSNLDELLTVTKFLLESQKIEYSNFSWSGGRAHNPKLYSLASAGDVEPSTMQTKIRAMIRYGFIEDNTQCPLKWTRMGKLWNELFNIGNYQAAKQIYELTLTISLAIFAFNNSQKQYSLNPAFGVMPLKFLLNNLNNHNSISLHHFSIIVDGNKHGVAYNTSYWKRDLINSGLFKEENDNLLYTGKFFYFVNEIKDFEPNITLTENDWKNIRSNPLIEISPFKYSIKKIFDDLIENQDIETQITDGILTEPLVDVITEQEDIATPEVDILSTNTRFAINQRRVRNSTWALRIKRKYNYFCAVPKCDVEGKIFTESAHIKPDNIDESDTPHRTHILNGICLCRHCHAAFDKGYFTLSNEYKIILSQKINDIAEQHLKKVITLSNNIIIKSRNDSRWPLIEFIEYHRNFKFIN